MKVMNRNIGGHVRALREGLVQAGVDAKKVEEAMVGLGSGGVKPIRITRRTISALKRYLVKNGDRCIVSVSGFKVKVLSWSGYNNLLKNAVKARAGKKQPVPIKTPETT